MNQRPTGFLPYKSAEGLSPVTVTGYDHDLKLWIEYQGIINTVRILSHFWLDPPDEILGAVMILKQRGSICWPIVL